MPAIKTLESKKSRSKRVTVRPGPFVLSVQALPQGHVATWPEVAGAVRVAQGVRKEFLVASVDARQSVRFLSLERIRP